MELPIYLIGYMGAGKTTVGKIVAEELDWKFVDLDHAFKEIHGYTPAEYIREYGIEAFRKKEKYVVEDLAELPIDKIIYATGGGYPCWEDNMDCLHELGTSIYLRWKAEDLADRLMLTDLSERPILQGKNKTELLRFIQPQLEAREEYYQQANYTIDAPGFIEDADTQIAQEICRLIKSKMK
ncbi:MAG: shikimate kinase [Paludibacteraceae bacterium]|nr:shikimate kinase [Paludibacteraceae bacterium]